MHWLYLFTAIIAEIFATSMLKYSAEFTKLWPSIGVVVGYSVAFFMLTLTLRSMPIGIAYAIWASMGIVLITIIGWLFLDETLDLPAIIGMALIISGVLVMNLFSNSIH